MSNKTRFKLIAEVHLVLAREGNILLLRRFQTGYQDGNYALVAGHVDGNESAKTAMIREAYEEVGITLQPNDVQLVHTAHRTSNDGERVSFFFTAIRWQGEPTNCEPNKCDDVRWFAQDKLPDNLDDYVANALAYIAKSEPYSDYGFA
ncbi:MAG: NUDIX domain-containing protein [Deinococcota bacterium]